MAVGKSVNRIDAVAKVTGRAEYTEDLYKPDMLVARYFRSSIAHGRVKSIDCEKAKTLKGVEAVFTFEDVPKNKFATAGHPFSLDPGHQDVADRLLLTRDIRFMGDEIAIVVAQDEIIANNALKLIDVSYEEYKPLILPEDILKKDAGQIHKGSSNIVGEHQYSTRDLQVIGRDVDEAFENSDYVVEGKFETTMVQHCHIENHISYAYMDDLDRIVIISSTQIPHIARRIVGEALNMPLSRVRVIKPFIGGGFGNKQDVILEPMAAFLTLKLDGRAVQINLTREEGMIGTRARHPFYIHVKTGVMKDGTMAARDMDAISITGGYASHGHAIAAAGGSKQSSLYPRMANKFHARTLYANIPAAGAMRAYGSPQIIYALECATEDAARKINMDSVEFRLKNIARQGDMNLLSGNEILSCGLSQCLLKGKEFINWDQKKKEYENHKTGPIRKGLGVACLSYASGTYPVCVEIAGTRISLNQDGTVHVMVGATEIGQGSDTVVAQMAAQTLGLPYEHVRVVQAQDTDVTPFDTGAYASRQAYVVSNAVFRAATQLKEKILDHAGLMTGEESSQLNIIDGKIVNTNTNELVLDMKTLAMDSFYHKERGGQLTADVSHKTTTNAPVFGCTFVDITVDIPLCKIKINNIINVHDSGVILNPVQAGGQVHGGVFMGIGAALSEELMIDPETGYIYNNNLLDYKFPTFTDIPRIHHDFAETFEPTSGYGNKSLGEPPVISPPPAIRNALLDATGVSINSLPLSPHKLFTEFTKHGLMDSKGGANVHLKKHIKANSVDHAIALLMENPDARLIAGGTDVLIKLRDGKPGFSELVDIHGLEELNFIQQDGENNILIGSGVVFTDIIQSDIIKTHIPMLCDAVQSIGGPQVRNIATIGGNNCNGVTSADSASTLFALNAVLEIRGKGTIRQVPISDFYLGPGKVDLKKGEILTTFKITPENHQGYFGYFYKYAMRNAMDIATIGCAVNLKTKNHIIEDYRIAYGVAGPVPLRCPKTEKSVINKKVSKSLLDEISQTIENDVNPRTSWRAAKDFRMNIIKELSKRATKEALLRAGEEV